MKNKKKIIVGLFSLLAIIIFSNNYLFASNPRDSISSLINQSKGKAKVDLLTELVTYYWFDDKPKSLQLIEEALSLAENYNYKKGIAYCLNYKGIVFFISGDYELAFKYCSEANGIFTAINDTLGMAYSLRTLGDVKDEIGRPEESFKYYLESEKYFELLLIGRQDKKVLRQYSIMLNNFAPLLVKLKKFNDGIAALNKSYQISEREGNKQGMASVFSNLGMAYFQMEDMQKSNEYFNKALKLAEEINNPVFIAKILMNIGINYKYMKDYKNALRYHYLSADMFKKIEDKSSLTKNYILIANINYQYFKNFNDAIKYLDTAFYLSQITHSYLLLSEVSREFYELFEKMGNYKLAFEYSKKYSQYIDSLIDEEKTAQIERLHIAYKTEAKEKENQILKKDKQIASFWLVFFLTTTSLVLILLIVIIMRYRAKHKINKILDGKNQELNRLNDQFFQKNCELEIAYGKLKEADNTKAKFLSIIAHDLKNPFSSFKSTLEMLYDGYNQFNEDDRKEFLGLMKASSNHLYSLLENLLSWSRIKLASMPLNSINFDLKTIINDNVALLQNIATAKKQSIIAEIDDNVQIIADVNMINTVIRNLLTNAIKFSNEGQNIIIKAIENKEKVIIKVINKGVGLSEETKNKLFRIDKNLSTPGTNGESGTGLGLILCKEFIEINGGEIWVESIPGQGTTFSFSLKKGN
jgi:signal transduction histidine kinase